MNSLGRGSLASKLKPVLDIAWYLSWVALALASLILVSSAIAFIMDFFGYTPPFATELFETLRNRAMAFPILSAEIVALMVIIHRLRKIFATLISGDPFVPENAGHLRIIAIAIAAYQILRTITHGAVALLLTVMGMPVEGGASIALRPDIELGAWFAVGTLLIFAEVFREGARMRQEQKLTI